MARHTRTSPRLSTTRSQGPEWLTRDDGASNTTQICLVVCWSAAEPERIGEVALFDTEGGPVVLGRGGPSTSDPAERILLYRQRPGSLQPRPPLKGSGISRLQCVLRPTAAGLHVESMGRCPMLIDGVEAHKAMLVPGRVLSLKNQLVLYCTRRGAMPGNQRFDLSKARVFGRADKNGIVGESLAAWELREQLAFCAASNEHVLILGASGCGKELAARALHQLSNRGHHPLVARNAATFPSTLIDAELFGNLADYPNPGMSARPGIIGAAHDSTLFLDEIAELPRDLQSHLLRVLDRAGEYQRLGDACSRRSDFRLVAATNRDPSELRLDILARLTLHVRVPGLERRQEDIPLLVRHLLIEAAKATPAMLNRYCDETSNGIEPRVDPELIELLLRHSFTYNVRELNGLLWRAVSGSNRDFVALTPDLRIELLSKAGSKRNPSTPDSMHEPCREEIVDSLNRNMNHITRTSRELGLKNRFALHRLMKKYEIVVDKEK